MGKFYEEIDQHYEDVKGLEEVCLLDGVMKQEVEEVIQQWWLFSGFVLISESNRKD